MNKHEDHRNMRSHKSEWSKPRPRHLVILYDNKRDMRPTDSSDCHGNHNRKISPVHEETSCNEILGHTIPVREVVMLFQCVRCKDTPLTPPVHICASAHPSCDQCYTSDSKECNFCHEIFVGRNDILEKVIQDMYPTTALKLSRLTIGDSPPEEDIEHYDPALLAKLERAHYESIRNAKLANEVSVVSSGMTQETHRSDSEPSSVQQSSFATVEIPLESDESNFLDIFRVPPLQSYVPVKCPLQSCGGIVTGSAFISHFEVEHMSVPIIAADYNATNCKIAVNPSVFQDYNVQCLAIFLVPNELPVTPSIVKMVTANEESITEQIRLRKRSMVCLVLSSKYTYVSRNSSGSNGDGGETFFLAWAVCLYETPPIYYTIEVNSSEKLCTTKYCGPIGTLHESQNPDEVFKRGNCLVITPGLLRRLSNPAGNVEISVFFHPVSV